MCAGEWILQQDRKDRPGDIAGRGGGLLQLLLSSSVLLLLLLLVLVLLLLLFIITRQRLLPYSYYLYSKGLPLYTETTPCTYIHIYFMAAVGLVAKGVMAVVARWKPVYYYYTLICIWHVGHTNKQKFRHLLYASHIYVIL